LPKTGATTRRGHAAAFRQFTCATPATQTAMAASTS
jgi:hypothetical protein